MTSTTHMFGPLAILALVLAPLPALARSSLPDPRLTPDAINPAVTQATIHDTICVRGWTRTVRPPEDFTYQLKRRQIREYGYRDRRLSHYEEDHLIPLGLGGAPSDPKNLWPEPRHPRDGWSADKKDEKVSSSVDPDAVQDDSDLPRGSHFHSVWATEERTERQTAGACPNSPRGHVRPLRPESADAAGQTGAGGAPRRSSRTRPPLRC